MQLKFVFYCCSATFSDCLVWCTNAHLLNSFSWDQLWMHVNNIIHFDLHAHNWTTDYLLYVSSMEILGDSAALQVAVGERPLLSWQCPLLVGSLTAVPPAAPRSRRLLNSQGTCSLHELDSAEWDERKTHNMMRIVKRRTCSSEKAVLSVELHL